jgi:hypothetical protein
MTVDELKQKLVDNDCEDTIVFENPDYADAFVGVTMDDVAVYDYEKMVECLMKQDNIGYFEAAEFIDYNTIGAYFGEKTPIIIRKLL